MPIIRKQLPDVSVDAVGYVDKALEQRIGRNAANFSLIGRVPDLHPYFLNHRIMVAPTRFAAGIPQKVFDAAVTGLPTVCSPLIASQMQWTDGEETLIGSIQDPEYFAAQCIKLYTQQDTWEKVYDQSLQSMREYASHYNLARGVEELLAKIAQSMSKKAPDRAGTLDTQPLSQSAA
jgi:glycosyltransferase involved in cell wall biosynthesis